MTVISPASGPLGGGQVVTIYGRISWVRRPSPSAAPQRRSVTVRRLQDNHRDYPGPQRRAGRCRGHDAERLGTGTGNNRYTYADAPTVTVISPNNGPLVGGQSVTITGTNFTINSTSVTIGGQPATNVVVTSPTTLTATTPAHAAGQVDVVVTTPSGSVGTGNRPLHLRYCPDRDRDQSGHRPDRRPPVCHHHWAEFHRCNVRHHRRLGRRRSVTVTATTITATTPAHAAGQVDVVVTTPIGTGTGIKLYTYVSARSRWSRRRQRRCRSGKPIRSRIRRAEARPATPTR